MQKEHENCGTEDCCQQCDTLIEQARVAEEPLFKDCDLKDGPLAGSARWNWYGAGDVDYFTDDEDWDWEEENVNYLSRAEDWWETASQETKELAFMSVVARIYKAELQDKGSYRWALYDVFGFDAGMYEAGMECGYMELHNMLSEAICTGEKDG